MSVRSTTLCDHVNCARASIGSCFLCAKDLCELHTVHKQALKVVIVLQSGGPKCEHDGKATDVCASSTATALVCQSCTGALSKYGVRFNEVAEALSDHIRNYLKAALVEEGLK